MGSDAERSNRLRSGGQILVDQLRIHGVERVFCVPGESYLAVLDAFHDTPDVDIVVCRQEGGAAMMAEAHGKWTGRPGICFVTRGPGASNAAAGLHIAYQDSTPMVLFVGQNPRGVLDREAFQEVDYRRMFGQMAKWVAQIDQAERIPEYVSRAFHTAANGRPGPVVLAVPEDMLVDRVETADSRRFAEIQPAPDGDDLARLEALLGESERPFAIVGGGGWDAESIGRFEAFAGTFDIPVSTAFRSQSHFDNRRDHFAGPAGIGMDPKLAGRIRSADLLLAVGARLGELTTGGYDLVEPPVPRQRLVHVYPDAAELGRVFQPTLGIVAGMKRFAAAVARLAPPSNRPWAHWRAEARSDYEAFRVPEPIPGLVQMGEIVAWLNERLPEDAIVANGAGNYSGWLHKNYQWKQYRTQLGPTSGTMGYGLPAAVAAKLAEPKRMVVAFAGDGCLMMTVQELATAVQHGANIVVIVVNNGLYGTIRMHQEREYPARVSATALRNPDFAAMAKSFGMHGETVEKTDVFTSAFERSVNAGIPALIELRIDPEAITPRTTLAAIREQARARLRRG